MQLYDEWDGLGVLERFITDKLIASESALRTLREERDRALEALRELWDYAEVDGPAAPSVRATVRAVLANHPAPKLSPAPEIRYQLRNWHHVTCTIPFAGPCTCLEAREKLIGELVLRT